MQQRSLGDLKVSALGLGTMGMSEFYGPTDEAQALSTLAQAVELGISLFDTADMYGVGKNEELLAKFLRTHRNTVNIATKFGFMRAPDGTRLGINGHPDYVVQACEASLKRLNVETIDLYYQHRVDPTVPIEETVGAMAELVRCGMVRHLGISEVNAEQIRRAYAVHPITAVQNEYSLWTRDPEAAVLATCRELKVGLVAYSPLGRGFLSGNITGLESLSEDDFRRTNPRFSGGNLEKNLEFLPVLEELAHEHQATKAQVALAWLLAQEEFIVPIPGTKRVRYLQENVGATELTLTPQELAQLDAAFPPGSAAGERYAAPVKPA